MTKRCRLKKLLLHCDVVIFRILSNNQIEVITNSMAFKKLRNLKKIDLSNNQINAIEDGAFAGATSVVSL